MWETVECAAGQEYCGIATVNQPAHFPTFSVPAFIAREVALKHDLPLLARYRGDKSGQVVVVGGAPKVQRQMPRLSGKQGR